MHTLLTFILLLLLLGNAFAQGEWPTFKSTEENFTISLPREPKQERTTARTPLGNGHHIYTTEDNDVSFTVSYSMLENAPTQPKDIKRTLDMVRDLVAMATNGKLLIDAEISIDHFPGRLVRIEKDKRIWTVHAYLVKDRLYQLMTTEPKAKEQNASAAKFFESFHLYQNSTVDKSKMPTADAPYAKVYVSKSGEVTLDGKNVTLGELDRALGTLAQKHGVVLYSREAPQETEPHPVFKNVLDIVVKNKLPVRLCVKSDCLDALTPDGKLRIDN